MTKCEYMFTGIITHLGTIQDITKTGSNTQLKITSPLVKVLKSGHSVAVNGACLTVLDQDSNSWTHHLMAETLARTNLGRLNENDQVNLETAVSFGDKMNGHFVQGHIDGICEVTDITPQGQDTIITFKAPVHLLPYIVAKGSIALDGVSLTVVDIKDTVFTVSMFPYTLKHTIFGRINQGYHSNLEVDIIGRYVERLLSLRPSN